MKFKVSITREIEAEDEKLAALEGYKQIMLAGTGVDKVILNVRDVAGNGTDITLSVDDADDYSGFTPPTGFMG